VDNLSLFACFKKVKFVIFAFLPYLKERQICHFCLFAFSKTEANLPFLPFLIERQICHFCLFAFSKREANLPFLPFCLF